MQTNNVLTQAVQPRGGNNRDGRGGEFGEFMNTLSASEAASRQTERSEGAGANNRRQDNQQAAQSAQNIQNDTEVNQELVSQQEQVSHVVQEGDAASYADYVPVDDAVLIDIVIDEDAILAELAAALGISLEQLTELIADMDLALEDFLEADNRLELLMAAKGLESHAELLNYPEALPMVQKLAQVVESYTTVTTYANPLVQEAEIVADVPVEDAGLVETANREAATTAANLSEATESLVATTTAQLGEVAIQNAQQTAQIENAPMVAMPTAIDAPAPTAQSTADATATPVPMQSVTPQNIVSQILSNVRFFSGEGMAEIRIKLTPAQLGDLSMRIATHNGIVTAQFIAENSRVKELIEAGLNMLRDSLEEAGITVDGIEVNVRGEGGYQDFENDGHISDSRIRDLMAQGELAEEEATEQQPLEENLVDYRI